MTKKLLTFPMLILGITLLASCTKNESSFSETQNGQNSVLNENKTNEGVTDTSPASPVKPPPESTEAETESDLVTYTDNNLGFKFDHPENWTVDTAKAEPNSVPFMDKNKPQGGEEMREAVTVEENSENLSLDEAVDAFIKERDYTEDMVTKNFSIKIGGEDTTKIETNDFGLTYYFFLHDDKIYRIDTQGNLFNTEVLKTFKFTS